MNCSCTIILDQRWCPASPWAIVLAMQVREGRQKMQACQGESPCSLTQSLHQPSCTARAAPALTQSRPASAAPRQDASKQDGAANRDISAPSRLICTKGRRATHYRVGHIGLNILKLQPGTVTRPKWPRMTGQPQCSTTPLARFQQIPL